MAGVSGTGAVEMVVAVSGTSRAISGVVASHAYCGPKRQLRENPRVVGRGFHGTR